jgi:hypothetical protein
MTVVVQRSNVFKVIKRQGNNAPVIHAKCKLDRVSTNSLFSYTLFLFKYEAEVLQKYSRSTEVEHYLILFSPNIQRVPFLVLQPVSLSSVSMNSELTNFIQTSKRDTNCSTSTYIFLNPNI